MYATLYLLEINKHSYLMTCHAYMLTGVGLDLMHLLGWVSMHDTHHHMGFLRKKICSWYFLCMDFWVVTVFSPADLTAVPRWWRWWTGGGGGRGGKRRGEEGVKKRGRGTGRTVVFK